MDRPVLSLTLIGFVAGLPGIAVAAPPQGTAQVCAQAIERGRFLSGDDIREIVDKLKSSGIEKGKFETTQDFKKRENSAISAIRSEINDKVGAPLIVVSATPSLLTHSTYNADKGTMTFTFKGYTTDEWEKDYRDERRSPLGDTAERVVSILSETRQDTGSYEGQNAYGVKMTVTNSEIKKVGVSVLLNVFPRRWPVNDISVSFKISPIDAAKLERTARIVYAAEMTYPYTFSYERESTPTLDYPMSTHTSVVSIVATPLCVALYDPNRKVLLKELPTR